MRQYANKCESEPKDPCEYCHSPEQICTTRFTIDHILPRSLNGSDHLNNLAFACRRCNERRYNFVAGYDQITETIVPLFNPRQQQWSDHFIWSADGKEILEPRLVEQRAIALISMIPAIQKRNRSEVRENYGKE